MTFDSVHAKVKKYARALNKLVCFAMLGLLFLSVAIPKPIYAQNTGASGVGGFTGCDYSSIQDNPKGGTEIFGKCIKQVMTFAFVVALFLIVFRVAFAAFNSLNPNSDGDAIKNSVTAIRDISIGVVLLISPAIILSVVNPTTLSLQIFNLGNLGGGNTTTSPTTPPSGGTTTGTTPPGGGTDTTTPTTPTTPTDITKTTKEEYLNPTAPPANVDTPTELFTLANYVANHSTNSPIDTNAKKQLEDIRKLEQPCQQIIIPELDEANCKKFKNSEYSPVFVYINKKLGGLPPLTNKNFTEVVKFSADVTVTKLLAVSSDTNTVVVKYQPTSTTGVTSQTSTTAIFTVANCKINSDIKKDAKLEAWTNITNDKTCRIAIL